MHGHYFLRYAPHGPGITVALTYAVFGPHVYGWYGGAHGDGFSGAFFALHRFYSGAPTIVLRSMRNDLWGSWLRESPGGAVQRVHSPLPDALAHQVDRLHAAFQRDWMFDRDAPDEAHERERYAELGIPLRGVNLRATRFDRFDRSGSHWRCDSAEADAGILERLARRWDLDERGPPLALAS